MEHVSKFGCFQLGVRVLAKVLTKNNQLNYVIAFSCLNSITFTILFTQTDILYTSQLASETQGWFVRTVSLNW